MANILATPQAPALSTQAAGNALGGAAAGAIASGAQGAAASQQAQAPNPFNPQTQVINQSAGILGTPAYSGSNPLAAGTLNLGGNVQYTPSGGVIVPQSQAASLANAKSSTPPQYNADESTYNPAGLSQYVTNTYTTPSGAQVTTDMNGNITGTTPPPQYSINTEGSVPSDAMYGGTTMNDVMNGQSTYAGLVNALAQAQGYSPAYTQALGQQYTAQSFGAALGTESADITQAGIQNTGPFQGLTQSQVQAENSLLQAPVNTQQALNTQQQTEAGINLNTQQLARTGNIAAAQAELQYSPTGISGANAINQYQQLQQQYPNAGIPPYNPNGDPLQQYQNAYNMVATSPAYQSQFTQTYATPGGGTGILNKLSLGLLQQNTDGTYSLVSGAANSIGATNAQILENAGTQYSAISSSMTSVQQTQQTMSAFMNQYGLNQSDVPILNQIQNAVKSNLAPAGAVAAYQTDVQDLQQAYAGFLAARSGSTAGVNETADSTIDINELSPTQLQQVTSQILQDGQNAQQGFATQIQTAVQGLQSGSTQQSQAGSSGITSASNLTSGWNWSTMQ